MFARKEIFLPTLAEVTDRSFSEEVIASMVPVVVEFTTEQCPACVRALQWLEDCAEAYGDRVRIVKARFETNLGSVDRLNIRTAPSFLVFQAGDLVARQPGCPDRSRLLAWIDRAVGADPASARDIEWIKGLI